MREGGAAMADPGWGIWGKCPPPLKKLHTRSRYSNRAANYSNKAVTINVHEAVQLTYEAINRILFYITYVI